MHQSNHTPVEHPICPRCGKKMSLFGCVNTDCAIDRAVSNTPLPSKGQEGEAERKEYILYAAIWYKDQPTPKIQVANVDTGLVLCGHRHGHIIHQFVALTGKRSVETECGRYVQGFLTNIGRFINRKEAMNIAKESGQLTKAQSFEELFSEDLY